MTDVLSTEQRRLNMSRIHGKDTKPEMLLRRALFAKGFRYRLHRRDLPGCPDIVFPSRQSVIFVHGCFWHGHSYTMFKMPSTRTDFWRAKISQNQIRDQTVMSALKALGWRAYVVWECSMRGPGKRKAEEIADDIISWLDRSLT